MIESWTSYQYPESSKTVNYKMPYELCKIFLAFIIQILKYQCFNKGTILNYNSSLLSSKHK